ncbi:pentatricopeptide repeat-containing protein At1g77170, mitochondrial [Cynara cardunculus var. scolymus]|uniref:Pentatricopeptide repeat-containing protein n=1 Tax=Cynara cardunculus var. scolymus TaxID=59895 RepID=A0A118K719_CYNCS|nr:pentatricopeptide repeat-containing protein At1g77170, mitochondrial [Cynara cardunculus var. scolymus]KVI11568.1 Pentatricopeptide repeat-containing protein [Cynara cardunculus var. scolymus]
MITLAKTLSTQITNCTNIQQLNQIYAHVIRIHMLDLYTEPFYWNTIIRAYTRLSSPSKALYVTIAMTRAGVYPDTYTLPVVLKAVSQENKISIVRQLHTVAMKHGLETNLFCESGLISLYAKAGEFDDALKLFDESPERNLGSWNAVIGGLSQGGCAREAVDMFFELKRSGLEPDNLTMVSLTSACGTLGNLGLALQLHKCVFQAKTLNKSDILMSNSLVDMYGKCGRMDLAYRVFSRMRERNISSWTSLIVGYAIHGHVNDALQSFHQMQEASVRPNGVTFVGVLSACVHGGLVHEGKRYFNMMKNEYRIEPWLQHYGCMVDLLSRCGLLEEAREMVEAMPMEGNVVIWGSLMGGCEKYGNVKMGEWVGKHLQEMEPWNDGVYVVMSNIYASNGLWEDVGRMRRIMKERRLAKIPGYSLGA